MLIPITTVCEPTGEQHREGGPADGHADDGHLGCEWLDGGLAFNRRSLHACLIVHHQAGYPLLAEYSGGPLPLASALREREAIRTALRSGAGHPACTGCPHLTRKPRPPTSHPITLLGIAQYSHCNIACSYCFLQTQDPASFAAGFTPYPILGQIRDLLATGLLAPDATIDWGGGEPSIYREFQEILALTLAAGAFHYVHSNAVEFPEVLVGNPHADRVHVICSLDAGTRETYLRIKQRDCLDRVWTNLRRYLDQGCRVTAKYIVRDDNIAEADLAGFLAGLTWIGISDVILDIDYDQPLPSAPVIAALGHLKHRILAADINVRYGFTGDNFAPENRVMDQVEAAFQSAQLATLERFLRDQGHHPGPLVERSAIACIRDLAEHCAGKDAALLAQGQEIALLHAVCQERHQALLAQAACIAELTAICAERDRELTAKEVALDRLSGRIAELAAEGADKDRLIAEHTATATGQDPVLITPGRTGVDHPPSPGT